MVLYVQLNDFGIILLCCRLEGGDCNEVSIKVNQIKLGGSHPAPTPLKPTHFNNQDTDIIIHNVNLKSLSNVQNTGAINMIVLMVH